MKKVFCFLIPILTFFNTGCKRNSANDLPTDDPIANDAPTVIANITGMVVNENNLPVNGVAVTSGSNSTVTDRYGIFYFKEISMSQRNAVVKVTQPGYFTAYRTFLATANSSHNVRIKLIPKANSGSFSAASGGTINIGGGNRLVVPASSVVSVSGNTYIGIVNVAATWINPTAADLSDVIPGDLRGLTTDGRERALETFGMLGVELTGSSGEPLQIAAGKTAELSFLIPTALQASAPATIPLWYFDEAIARWKEEGVATKTGTVYIGNVSHFTFWNIDKPLISTNLCLTLVDSSGQSLNNRRVTIKRISGTGQMSSIGITNLLGDVCVIVPKNENLILDVEACGGIIYSQNIGPFSSNASLGNITVNMQTPLFVTGQFVNCNNTPITNGWVSIYVSPGKYYSARITNGNFSIPVDYCGSIINFIIKGFDYATGMMSVPISGSGNTGIINIGIRQICNSTSTIQNWQSTMVGYGAINFTLPADIVVNNSNILSASQTNTRIKVMNGAYYEDVSFTHNETTGQYIATCTFNTIFGAGANFGNGSIILTEVEAPGGFIAGSFNIPVQIQSLPPPAPPSNTTLIGAFRYRRQ